MGNKVAFCWIYEIKSIDSYLPKSSLLEMWAAICQKSRYLSLGEDSTKQRWLSARKVE